CARAPGATAVGFDYW
nr:immunoglobulin heavy chain junction region [Macaca mulatta]